MAQQRPLLLGEILLFRSQVRHRYWLCFWSQILRGSAGSCRPRASGGTRKYSNMWTSLRGGGADPHLTCRSLRVLRVQRSASCFLLKSSELVDPPEKQVLVFRARWISSEGACFLLVFEEGSLETFRTRAVSLQLDVFLSFCCCFSRRQRVALSSSSSSSVLLFWRCVWVVLMCRWTSCAAAAVWRRPALGSRSY